MTQTQSETEVNEEPQEEPEILLPNTTIVTHCILKNDIPRFAKCFEDDTDPYKETITELLNTRDDDGKAPLDVASTLGRTEMIKELIQRGADVSSVTPRGKLQFRCFFFFFSIGSPQQLLHSSPLYPFGAMYQLFFQTYNRV